MRWGRHDGRSGLEALTDGNTKPRLGLGVGNNYWDLSPFAGRDAYATSYLHTTLPSSVTFVNGRATARVTFATPGSQSVTVRGGAAGTISATASADVVGAPVAVGFSILLPRAVAVGVSTPVTLLAVDAQGRPVPRFSGTATLASSDTAAALPAAAACRSAACRPILTPPWAAV